jgi:hypothetical protein
MKRRAFLRVSGMAAAGAAVGGPVAAGKARAAEVPAGAARPTLLITSAENRFAQALAAALAGRWTPRLTSAEAVETEHEFLPAPLDADDTTRAVVRGATAVVHVAAEGEPAALPERIDRQTRCLYNLLRAAVAEGVRGVVHLSSLATVAAYPEKFLVTEDWRPAPPVDSPALADYLGEFTCREFARDGRLRVVVLRLGRVVRAEEAADRPADDAWLDQRDAAQAVDLALRALTAGERPRLEPWSVFHIAAESPGSRFPIARAKRVLGFQPQHNG